MPVFSAASASKLRTCDARLQLVFNTVIRFRDCTILEGYRGEADQNRLLEEGKTELAFPRSRHNTVPSRAVDVAPYPIDWDDVERFFAFCHFVKGIAAAQGIPLISGGLDWKDFQDWPHWELAG